MAKEGHKHLELGVGILRVLRDQKFSWLTSLKELIDNSIGARAKKILFRRTGDVFEIIDDGDGCEDLYVMESPAKSIRHPHNKASMFGIGGVMSQIQISQGSPVEVISVHAKGSSEITIDWNQCIENNEFKPSHEIVSKPIPGDPTGTTIRILRARRMIGVGSLVRELGHDYAGELRRGKLSIAFVIDGQVTPVVPFSPPPLDRRIDFDFDFNGHRIRGFTGIVKPGTANTYKGWSVHWGYRFAFITKAPGGDHIINRIYGEINLPRSWENITPTKDDFTDNADDLWEMVAEKCSELIVEADEQSTDIELNEASVIAGDILTSAIAGRDGHVKGRRPEVRGETGSKVPTGRGGKHKNFEKHQPGDRPCDRDGVPLQVKAPSRIRIAWDATLEHPYSIDITGTRKTTMTITLNKANPQIYDFKSDPRKLSVMCCGHIAQEITSNVRFYNVLPLFQSEDYRETYAALLRCLPCAA